MFTLPGIFWPNCFICRKHWLRAKELCDDRPKFLCQHRTWFVSQCSCLFEDVPLSGFLAIRETDVR